MLKEGYSSLTKQSETAAYLVFRYASTKRKTDKTDKEFDFVTVFDNSKKFQPEIMIEMNRGCKILTFGLPHPFSNTIPCKYPCISSLD